MRILRWSLQNVCDMIKDRRNNKFDAIVFIDGVRGIGKSTLAYEICSRVKGAGYFNPKKDIVYSQKDVMEELSRRENDILFVDEAINVAYNRDFYSENQKDLIKMLNMYRDRCNLYIGCIPNFYNLDKQIQRLCCMRITVLRRGVAIIHLPKPAMFNNDVWDTDSNKKEEIKWNKFNMKPRYAKLSTFAGMLTFNDLTVKQRETYEQVKNEKRSHIMGTDDIQIKDNVGMIVDKILEGKIDMPTLKTLGDVSGLKWDRFRNNIRKKLNEKGEERKLRELVPNSWEIDT